MKGNPRRSRLFIRLAVCMCMLPAAHCLLLAQAPPEKFDVVVVGGSSAGVGAALGAARLGVTVALIEDTPVLGGMLANGISNIDTYSLESLSGVFEEFRLKVREYYLPQMATDPFFKTQMAMPRHVDGRSRAANDPDAGGRWEPHVADRIFKDMVASLPNIRVFYDRWAVDAIREGQRVTGVVTEGKTGGRKVFLGGIVVDATHEADVAAWARAPYRVGREPQSPLEPHAGQIYFFNKTGEIMEGSTGRQDRAIVSYGLRLTVKHYSDPNDRSHILAEPPPGYDKSKYEPTSYNGRISMPNQKAEMNQNPIGNELQEINWVWPEANREERLKLYEVYKNHALGFLYFLQHEKGLTHLGLPKDEFTDNGNVPYRVFVREARRIVGEATLTEADINPFILGRGWLPPHSQDSIAVGHYPLDSKPVRRKTDLSTPDKSEGDFYLVNVTTPFQVPYGSIIPKQVYGLLVPAALSATHVAFSSVRMDPTWTVLGQAAGVAAALSARRGGDVRATPVEQIQRELIRQRCRLMFYWDLPIGHAAFPAVQWLSVRKVVTGYPDRLFRPDQILSRAEMAALLTGAFKLWPSVSEIHFNDVPAEHWAFREIETLFDRRALGAFGVRPRWPEARGYNPSRDSGFARSEQFGSFSPTAAVRWRELVETIHAVRQQQPPADPAAWVRRILSGSMFGGSKEISADANITRGEASMLIASFLDGGER